MALSDPVPASKQIIKNGHIAQGRANSESTMGVIGGVLNAINQASYNDMSFIMNGYVANMTNNSDNGWGGVRHITADVNISEYYMTLARSGSGSSCSFNANVYDENGAFVNSLFSTAISISGGNGVRVKVGKDVEALTNFSSNTSGHSVNHGTLNLTALLKGWSIESNIGGGKNGAKNLFFNLKLKEV